jgi:hypothetical protein
VHRKYIPIYIEQDATLHSLFISVNCSTCFGWYFHPSSGAHTTVSTASGICHTVTAICRYRGIAGTGLSVLWVAYATHSTLKPVKIFHCSRFPRLVGQKKEMIYLCIGTLAVCDLQTIKCSLLTVTHSGVQKRELITYFSTTHLQSFASLFLMSHSYNGSL